MVKNGQVGQVFGGGWVRNSSAVTGGGCHQGVCNIGRGNDRVLSARSENLLTWANPVTV